MAKQILNKWLNKKPGCASSVRVTLDSIVKADGTPTGVVH